MQAALIAATAYLPELVLTTCPIARGPCAFSAENVEPFMQKMEPSEFSLHHNLSLRPQTLHGFRRELLILE